MLRTISTGNVCNDLELCSIPVLNHVCANDKQNLMNVRLIRANLEPQIVALTSTQSMLRAIKDYTDFLSRNFAVKIFLGEKQNLCGPNFKLYAVKSVRVRR